MNEDALARQCLEGGWVALSIGAPEENLYVFGPEEATKRCQDALWGVTSPILNRIIAVLEQYRFHNEEECDGPEDLLGEVKTLCEMVAHRKLFPAVRAEWTEPTGAVCTMVGKSDGSEMGVYLMEGLFDKQRKEETP
jgi:hypothetical protein